MLDDGADGAVEFASGHGRGGAGAFSAAGRAGARKQRRRKAARRSAAGQAADFGLEIVAGMGGLPVKASAGRSRALM